VEYKRGECLATPQNAILRATPTTVFRLMIPKIFDRFGERRFSGGRLCPT